MFAYLSSQHPNRYEHTILLLNDLLFILLYASPYRGGGFVWTLSVAFGDISPKGRDKR